LTLAATGGCDGGQQGPGSRAAAPGVAVLHVRLNLITADPQRLGDAIKYMEAEVRPAVEMQRGNLGISLQANPELGVAVLESFWVSADALRDSERIVAPARLEAVRLANTGTVTVERYRVPVFELEGPMPGGAGVRLTRMDVERSKIENAVEVFGDTAVPWLAETEGFCSALLFVDHGSGRSISQTVWQDAQALAASRSTAAAVRVDAVAATDCVIRAVEEFSLVFSSVRKA
jgi:quinol monooxygenase YgiN